MAKLGIEAIAEILEARSFLDKKEEQVSRILLDSRQYSSAAGVIFFALRGKRHNGHDHIRELIEKGVRNFVVEKIPSPQPVGVNFLQVHHALAALQKLARHIRMRSSARIVAITGSNGKTVVKEWLSQMLQSQYKVCRSPKSYNSQIGVPLSVWELEDHHQLGVFEAGISQPGEMARLQEVLHPQLGIFTNIGSAHAENFRNAQQKIAEKLKLFEAVEALVYQKNDTFLSKEIEAFAHEREIELLSWSYLDDSADLFVAERSSIEGATRFHLQMNGEDVYLDLPFSDEASQQNAMHALRMALHLKMPLESLRSSMSQLQAVEMRLQMKMGNNGNLIINDAYNSDLESLRIALHFLENHGVNQDRVLILSDMLQSGLEPAVLNERMSEIIARFSLKKVIGIGPNLYEQGLKVTVPTDLYPDTESFLSHIYRYNWSNTALLLKGARSFRFEKISQRLEQKSHETRLNIYLDRMVGNLNYFRRLLSPQTGIMAMVKAFSYGSGSTEIAHLLQFHGVDYLGVAYTDEGVELRKAGVNLPILVLNPERSSLEDLVTYRLEPEIYSFSRLEEFVETLSRLGVSESFPIHLKIETGMHRLGFTEDQLPELVQRLKNLPQLTLASVFSHLAAADDPDQRDFSQGQIAQFEKMTARLRKKLGGNFKRHLCNSSGILNYPEAHFDMVRLGISLYGIGSNEEAARHLKVVSELKASVSQLKKLQPGDSVSYGRHFIADKETTIAVVSIGYADGFRRSLSNGVGEVAIAGKRYPVVGNVCMDMIMVDVTGSTVAEGDEVEIFGASISVNELAAKMNTIPYELFTGIGRRVKRVYFME